MTGGAHHGLSRPIGPPAPAPDPFAKFKRYTTRKSVRAALIVGVEDATDDRAGGVLVQLGATVERIPVAIEWLNRYQPRKGDFLIRYEKDGYLSVSPAKPFLESATEVLSLRADSMGR